MEGWEVEKGEEGKVCNVPALALQADVLLYLAEGRKVFLEESKTLGKRILKYQTGQARTIIKQNEGTIICNWYQRLKFIK